VEAEGLDQRAELAPLLAQIVRHVRTLPFVRRIERVPEALAHVEDEGDVVGLVLAHERQEHPAEAVEAARREAVRGAHVRLDRVVRAECVVRRVDEEQFLRHAPT
jgi:hypothetical protein